MDLKKELRLLTEIESSIEPVFGLFFNAQAYNGDFQPITNDQDPTAGKRKYTLAEWDKLVKWVVLDRDDYIQYIMPIIPHAFKDGKVFFDYKALSVYGADRERGKFFVIT